MAARTLTPLLSELLLLNNASEGLDSLFLNFLFHSCGNQPISFAPSETTLLGLANTQSCIPSASIQPAMRETLDHLQWLCRDAARSVLSPFGWNWNSFQSGLAGSSCPCCALQSGDSNICREKVWGRERHPEPEQAAEVSCWAPPALEKFSLCF